MAYEQKDYDAVNFSKQITKYDQLVIGNLYAVCYPSLSLKDYDLLLINKIYIKKETKMSVFYSVVENKYLYLENNLIGVKTYWQIFEMKTNP